MKIDKIVLGGGLYGLYASLYCGKRGESVAVLEADRAPFERATYVNQARVHQGYHYPRSLSTALKSAHYFRRFCEDFDFCINRNFSQIYATASDFSWTCSSQFEEFCAAASVPCERVDPDKYFRKGLVDGAFRTCEYTYDARMLRDYFLEQLSALPNVVVEYGAIASRIARFSSHWEVALLDGRTFCAPFVLNASYASVNQVMRMAGFSGLPIKYELCEMALCHARGPLVDVGITVMDGPFFSIMPFGKTGMHSLTSVAFTPHVVSFDECPRFDCQRYSGGYCSEAILGNCNHCVAQPASASPYMAALARKFLREEYAFEHDRSLFSMKPILVSSEIDDSRPTVVRVCSEYPTFVSALSGKINTVYDLDEVLDEYR